ncbi:MND1-interacting protein 1 [Acorus calamus]|uniref:MND1-interacting protein 1 n=1 Tax=Acorus calamus TaxID=4465 RepID=A0AAV9E327_ACOCL|nr:MND1-interacting protein 1 [Acorus calamus]
MGCNTRDRSIRNNRKSRHHHNPPPPPPSNPAAGDPPPSEESENPNIDDSGWGYCTEDQLEEVLLTNLEFIYREAQAKLVSLGYSEEIAIRSLLHNGHCYGSMDPLTNVLHNAISYINSSSSSDARDRSTSSDDDGGGDDDDGESSEMDDHGLPLPTNLRQLQQYSLAAIICLLQQVRPNLSRGDAMWCLLMSDLHVGRAAAIEIPSPPPPPHTAAAADSRAGGGDAASPALLASFCRLHDSGGWEEVDGEFEIEIPKGLDLNPSMKSLLRRNVAMFAAGFRANSGSGRSVCHPPVPSVVAEEEEEETEIVESVLRRLEEMSIGEEAEEEKAKKKEVIVNLAQQVKELEVQVKERREWAQKKALQAAKKLSADLSELKLLRMEREENRKVKEGNQMLEDTTMKRLSEMEVALRKASGQVDRANAAMRKLEAENAEIRAEMEASKLSESESKAMHSEITRRVRRQEKKIAAAERMNDAMSKEVEEMRQRFASVHQQIQLVQKAQKEAEVKWKQEIRAKELAIVQVEEERRARGAAEVNVKRTHEALRRKIEIDFQRHKDDIQRLKQELSRLNASIESTPQDHVVRALSAVDVASSIPPLETNTRMLNGSQQPQDSLQSEASQDRKCLICKKNEVSVVFLPCAHQVICFNCSEDNKKAKTSCQCCGVPIKQRIHVFGARS